MAGVKRSMWLIAVLGIGLMGAGANLARADDHDRECERRIHRAEEKLQREIDRHGEHSRQAEQKRHDLEEARRSCGDHH